MLENENTNTTAQGAVQTEPENVVQEPKINDSAYQNQQFNDNAYQNQQYNNNYQNQTRVNTNYNSDSYIPKEYKPLSPWAYFGYNLLFSIPLIGLIMMIVFAFDSSNINRRNYSRSFFCAMLVGFIIGIVAMIVMFLILGLSFSAFSSSASSGSISF